MLKLDYRELLPLQGELKDFDEAGEQALLESLKQKGAFVPFFVWVEEWHETEATRKPETVWILDGHRRHHTYTKHDITIDGSHKVDCISIDADSLDDAKEKLLLISSQYGTITEEGLAQFLGGTDIDLDFIAQAIRFDALPDTGSVIAQIKSITDMNFLGGNTGGQGEENSGTGTNVQEPPEVPGGATGSGEGNNPDDYSNFTILMLHSNKLQLVECLDEIRENENLFKLEDALMHLVNLYNNQDHA